MEDEIILDVWSEILSDDDEMLFDGKKKLSEDDFWSVPDVPDDDGSLGGGTHLPPGGNTAPDEGRGALARPPTVAALHAARRAAAARGDNPDIALNSCYILGGVLDDILEVADAGKADDTVLWSPGVLAYAGITSNLPKDFLSTEPDALGAHVVLARDDAPTTVSPKTDKLRATLQHCYLWLALASGPGGWHAPFKWIESLDGIHFSFLGTTVPV